MILNKYIYPLTEEDLDKIPFHSNIDCIKRFSNYKGSVHIAVHTVTDAIEEPPQYVTKHSHNTDEINIILSQTSELTYKIKIGENEQHVTSPCYVLFPAGTEHAATVVKGSGLYICIILEDSKIIISK